MPPSNEHKRVKSIARRMGQNWAWRLFGVFIVLDIMILVLLVGGYCYTAELNAIGEFKSHTERTFDIPFDEGNLSSVLNDTSYAFWDELGTRHDVSLKPILLVGTKGFSALLLVEMLMVLCARGAGRRSANRALRPLTQISNTAQKLSSISFQEERFQGLEQAIAQVSPTAPGARVRTGDKELMGLETAVNNLLSRTRDSYKEQMRFVSDASHELRTPISVIQGYANMLSRWGKSDERILDESIAAIKTESEHMSTLIEQLLFLARGDSGRAELAVEEFSLTEMLREVYEEYKMIDPKHSYSFIADQDVRAVADQAMIKQVARTLTDNAIKYTPESGSIRFRVTTGKVPSFTVQDNGIGISDADIPRIFERFFRSDPSRDRATGGTGLGLSIAKWIVDRHGGHFEVLSRQEIGTRITVFLPIPAPEIQV